MIVDDVDMVLQVIELVINRATATDLSTSWAIRNRERIMDDRGIASDRTCRKSSEKDESNR